MPWVPRAPSLPPDALHHRLQVAQDHHNIERGGSFKLLHFGMTERKLERW